MRGSILFICPSFFGVDRGIELRLREMGFSVFRLEDRPVKSPFFKFLIRLMPKFSPFFFDRFFIRRSVAFGINFDYVFVISGQCVSPSCVAYLRRRFSAAKFLYYTWDSFKNRPNALAIAPMFDRCFSFDPGAVRDAREQFDIEFSFRPLFFIDDLPIFDSSNKTDGRFDNSDQATQPAYTQTALFLGSMHSDRFNVLVALKTVLNRFNVEFRNFSYVQSPLVFFIKKYITGELRSARYKDFIFSPLPPSLSRSEFEAADIIIDIEHPAQKGLTIRTFEVIKYNKKLITTNKEIIGYDFYDPGAICVISRRHPEIGSTFISSGGFRYNKRIRYKYSLEGWLQDIFNF